MVYVFMALTAVFILGLDQITKLLTVANIELYQSIEVIPGLFGLTYVRNDGAAFSIFSGQQWLFLLIFLIFAAFIIWEFPKKRLPLSTFERFCIVAVFAGGLGNMIDRLRLGYVIDMIDTETSIPFIANFPIFNVADIFVTCGCIALMVHIIFFNKEFWKDEKK